MFLICSDDATEINRKYSSFVRGFGSGRDFFNGDNVAIGSISMYPLIFANLSIAPKHDNYKLTVGTDLPFLMLRFL